MNIFVASLSFRASEDDVQDLFEQFGAVDSVKIVLDRDTGRSRGFGFVEMSNDEEANAAIKELNGAEFEGRALVVKQAEDRSNNRRGGGGGGGYNNNRYR
ncbi:UNVERIFIED_CONTAM: hypothetical protein GTU68_004995 [Idotea baltica]|nr:hypothetical protein [Idotea baltica]